MLFLMPIPPCGAACKCCGVPTGVVGMVSLCVLFLPPLVQLLLYRGVVAIGAAAAELFWHQEPAPAAPRHPAGSGDRLALLVVLA